MLERGAAALTDAELTAILLRTGSCDTSALDLARELLERAGDSLRNLSNFSYDNLVSIKGIGTAKAVTLLAAMEIGHRSMLPAGDEQVIITDAGSALDIMAPVIANLDHEECWVLFLNRSNRVIAKERLSIGGCSSTTIDVKLVVKKAVEKLACGIILIHNHPSGKASPGEKDRAATQALKKAAELLDIALLDHIIVAGNRYYSFCESVWQKR